MHVWNLAIDDVALVAMMDRSEHVEIEYQVVDGHLVERNVTMAEIPPWDPQGSGPHSVAHERESFAGLAAVNPAFEMPMACFGFLHVSRAYRRRGALYEKEPDDIHLVCSI